MIVKNSSIYIWDKNAVAYICLGNWHVNFPHQSYSL